MTDEEILEIATGFEISGLLPEIVSFSRALLEKESAASAVPVELSYELDGVIADYRHDGNFDLVSLQTLMRVSVALKNFHIPPTKSEPTECQKCGGTKLTVSLGNAGSGGVTDCDCKSEPGWQPIESAPKDKPILVFNAVCGPYISKFTEGEFPLGFWNCLGAWYPKPTHWRHIPAAPTEVESEPSNDHIADAGKTIEQENK